LSDAFAIAWTVADFVLADFVLADLNVGNVGSVGTAISAQART
jgi:hypothetical protein